MSLADIHQQSLERLPAPVRQQISDVGLLDNLERLIKALRDASLVDGAPARGVQDLLDWTLAVLASPSAQINTRLLKELHEAFAEIANHADNGEWEDCAEGAVPILQLLAAVPRPTHGQGLEAARALSPMLHKATESLAQAEESTSTRRAEVEAHFEQEADSLKRELSQAHDSASAEMTRLLKTLEEQYGFTANQVLGGAHDSASESEAELAERHAKTSRRAMWGATIWAGLAQAFWLSPWASEWDRWFEAFRSLPVVGSPIIILLFVAKREGRVAAEHREQHSRLRSQALHFKSWAPYRSTLKELPEEDQLDLERRFVSTMFPGDHREASRADAET